MQEYSHSMGVADSLILPVGSFVIPIEICYVPKHIKEHKRYDHINIDKEVFVYCHFGIIAIPRDIIREV